MSSEAVWRLWNPSPHPHPAPQFLQHSRAAASASRPPPDSGTLPRPGWGTGHDLPLGPNARQEGRGRLVPGTKRWGQRTPGSLTDTVTHTQPMQVLCLSLWAQLHCRSALTSQTGSVRRGGAFRLGDVTPQRDLRCITTRDLEVPEKASGCRGTAFQTPGDLLSSETLSSLKGPNSWVLTENEAAVPHTGNKPAGW